MRNPVCASFLRSPSETHWLLQFYFRFFRRRAGRCGFQRSSCQNGGKAMITYSRNLFLVAAAALLAGCSKQPESGRVKFETSKGDFVVQVNKEWAPLGAERFLQLVRSG